MVLEKEKLFHCYDSRLGFTVNTKYVYYEGIFIVEDVGLNSVQIQGKLKNYKLSEVLKVSRRSKEINNSLRENQLRMFKADKRIREREGISPDRNPRKRSRRGGNRKRKHIIKLEFF